MDAVKRKLHGVRVLLHGIASLLRTARPTNGFRGKKLPRRGRNFPRRGRNFPRHLRFVPRLPARTGRGVGVMWAGWVRFVGLERGLGVF